LVDDPQECPLDRRIASFIERERLAARGCDPLTRRVDRCGRATPREPSRESRHPRKGCRRREEPPRGERAPSRTSNAYGRRSSEGKTFQKRLPRFNQLADIRSTAPVTGTVLYGGCERETANSESHGRVFARHAATSRGPSGRSWETELRERPTGHSMEVKSPRHLERWRGPGEIQSWENRVARLPARHESRHGRCVGVNAAAKGMSGARKAQTATAQMHPHPKRVPGQRPDVRQPPSGGLRS